MEISNCWSVFKKHCKYRVIHLNDLDAVCTFFGIEYACNINCPVITELNKTAVVTHRSENERR